MSKTYEELFSDIDLNNVPEVCKTCNFLLRPSTESEFIIAKKAKNYAFRMKGPGDKLLCYCRVMTGQGLIQKAVFYPETDFCTKYQENILIRKRRSTLKTEQEKADLELEKARNEIERVHEATKEARNLEYQTKIKLKEIIDLSEK